MESVSLWSQYNKEREGNETIVDDQNRGFVEFRLLGDTLIIEGIYVEPDFRRASVGAKLLDRVLAGNNTAKFLWARVGTHYLNATDSLKACLGYGFSVIGLDGTFILLSKEIEHG